MATTGYWRAHNEERQSLAVGEELWSVSAVPLRGWSVHSLTGDSCRRSWMVLAAGGHILGVGAWLGRGGVHSATKRGAVSVCVRRTVSLCDVCLYSFLTIKPRASRGARARARCCVDWRGPRATPQLARRAQAELAVEKPASK